MATHDHQLKPPYSAFNQQAFEDPYLSGPSDLEEFGFEQHTPSASSADLPSRLSSISPADTRIVNNTQMQNYGFTDSFDETKYINFDPTEASDPLFLTDMISGVDGQGDSAFSNVDVYLYPKTEYQENEDRSPMQLISNTSTESNGSPYFTATTGQQEPELNVMPTGTAQTHQPSRLEIPDSAFSHGISSGYGHSRTRSAPSLSPVVKVSQVHRGDSPTRDDDEWNMPRKKRSSAHLSPTVGSVEDNEEFGQNEDESNARQTFSPSRAEDGSWVRDVGTGQAGIDPYARSDEFGPSPKDLENERQRAERDADIRIWSASVSAANSEAGDDISTWEPHRGRRRAVSAVELRQDYFSVMRPDDLCILGPGRVIDEPDPGSDFDTSSEVSHADTHDGLPMLEYTVQNEPLAQQLNRSYPWKEAPQYPFPLAIRTQPESSRSAMQLYEEMAKEMDKVSRVGTWGSKKLNDAEVDSLLKSDSFFKNLSLNKAAILKFFPRRSGSVSKDKKWHLHKASRKPSFESEVNERPQKKESISSIISRRASLNRPKSPGGIMAAAFAGQMAASIGGSHKSLSGKSPMSPGAAGSLSPAPWMGYRSRSKSEGSRQTRNLQPLAIPNIDQRQTLVQKSSPHVESRTSIGLDGDDDEDDDSLDDKAIFMSLAPSSQQIVPTYDGFKQQISQLDPRLEPALLHRFATEQLRRYKKLIDEQTKHAGLVNSGNCSAGDRCFASGGRAKLLPPRANTKDPGANYCQFQIPGHENIDDEDDGFDEENRQHLENAVIPAIFAEGIRMPPVKRLPAEFECTLCFKVKKFQKPSDWTKHIYEDIYPFTCTFPECAGEPKSFKRKADWVRHETERHRHLEWWTCNIPNCDHICYRKNNFVQHLVREHRKPDPTAKKSKAAAASGSGNDKEIAKLWSLVEECHHETEKRPEEEPCRFCGNVCKDWRKLMVHLARHMERIALPVLTLAEEHSSSGHDVMGVYSTTTVAQGPSISVYGSGEQNLAVEMDNGLSGLSQPTMVDNNGGQVQPGLMAYNSQQGSSHILSATMPMEISPSGTTYPPASPSYLQPHYTPVHRNSMSYPPAPNQVVRGPTTISTTMGPTPGISAFPQQAHVSTIGIDGPQQPLYQSPQDTCYGPDDYLPSSTSAVAAAAYVDASSTIIAGGSYPISASPEAETDPHVAAAYMTSASQLLDANNTYQSATYQF